MNRALLSSFPALGLLGVYFYFWSNNVTYFTGTAVLASSCLLALFGTAIFLFNYFAVWGLVEKVVKQKYQNVFHIIILSGIFSFLLAGFINYNISMSGWVLGGGMFLAVTALCLRGFGKWLALFLIIFLALQGANYTFQYGSLRHSESEILKDLENLSDVPKLVHKPNIYVYWLESYQDFPMLETTFGMDMSQFRDFLLKSEFHIGENIYSSASFTLGALSQFYTAKFIRETGIPLPDENGEAFWIVRDIIGGSKYNFVYRVLKQNGYETYFILPDNQWYYMNSQGEYLDEVAFSKSFLDTYFTPITNFLNPAAQKLFSEKFSLNNDQHIHGYEGSLVSCFIHAAVRAKNSVKPYIITIKGGAQHTPGDGTYNSTMREEWINSQYYQKLINHSNRETEKIINYIVKHDNNSIILLLGDHGPCTYREAPIDGDISAQDFMDDNFRVLFAWRMPDGIDHDLAQGMYMNNVNVFTHILAWMADNPKLLESRATSEALWWGGIGMKEGQVVRND